MCAVMPMSGAESARMLIPAAEVAEILGMRFARAGPRSRFLVTVDGPPRAVRAEARPHVMRDCLGLIVPSP